MQDSSALGTNASQAPEKAPARITLRSVLLGVATVVILNIYADYAGMVMGSFSLNKSQFPMAMLIPFGLWLFVNLGLKAFLPRAALSGTELLVIYSMSWIAGNIPFEGFTGYWASTLAAPTYFASPENRWEEAFFDALPWWYMPDASPAVIRPYYDGLAPETPPCPGSGGSGPSSGVRRSPSPCSQPASARLSSSRASGRMPSG